MPPIDPRRIRPSKAGDVTVSADAAFRALPSMPPLRESPE